MRHTAFGKCISIHAPVKGATAYAVYSRKAIGDFNPRSREGSDFAKDWDKYRGCNFNPRSREGSDQRPLPLWRRSSHFNPRSREGSDIERLTIILRVVISIHAPAKGATKFVRFIRFEYRISIHAPAKGATVNKLCEMIRLTDFNPRSREGSDVGSPQGNRYTRISIHAPAKGATQEHHRRWNAWLDFNPRSREGSDVCCRPCHLCL